MKLTVLELIIMGLAVFRLTHLIVFDKITEFIRSPFFNEITEADENGLEEVYLVPKEGGVRGFIGELLSCYWCTGMWMAFFCYAGFIFYPAVFQPFLAIMAVAGIGAILESAIQNWKSL